MSGSPKYSQVELEKQKREKLQQERHQKAAEEAMARAQAREQERKRRLEANRSKITAKANAAFEEIRKRRKEVYDQDALALEREIKTLRADVSSEADEEQLLLYDDKIQGTVGRLSEAAARKRRDEQEAKRVAELEQQRFRLSEVERCLKEIGAAAANKFDAEGAVLVGDALKRATGATAAGKSEAARDLVNRAEAEFRKHLQTVTQRRELWERERRHAEQVIGTLVEHVQGLRADPVLGRWHAKSVAALAARVAEAKHEVEMERFAKPAEILQRSKSIRPPD